MKEDNKEIETPAIFERRVSKESLELVRPEIHKLGNGSVCKTESRGYAEPREKSILEIVVDASEGFVPLWAEGVTLKWRFNDQSVAMFVDPQAVMDYVEALFNEAVAAWGDAAPITFERVGSGHDFEIILEGYDDCSAYGCTLAMAFFPNAGRNELRIYPKMFTQVRKEQVETLIHEIGHIYGLRHFFAQVSEANWKSHIFGTHSKFSIMNYGADSFLTDADRDDLRELYRAVWSGELGDINGTEIRFQIPYHQSGLCALESLAAAKKPM